MNAQYKKGVLELCVLKLIQQDDLYGYETVQKVSSYIEVTESTIYPLLITPTIGALGLQYTDVYL